jgi:hypothetical protein
MELQKASDEWNALLKAGAPSPCKAQLKNWRKFFRIIIHTES